MNPGRYLLRCCRPNGSDVGSGEVVGDREGDCCRHDDAGGAAPPRSEPVEAEAGGPETEPGRAG